MLMSLALVLAGAGCGGPSIAEQKSNESVTLNIWQVHDGASSLSAVMSSYKAIHPNVNFNFRQLRASEYEDELIRAFAEGRGPDIYAIHNTWVTEYVPLIAPMPSSLTIPYLETRGTIKKEQVVILKNEKTITPAQVRRDFVDVVSLEGLRAYQANSNAEAQERVFGLPLAVDTLALYYNKDLLNAAGIAEPPHTWDEFQKQVEKLTVVGREDKILQSGAALGSGKNVERAFDILSVLMMQNQARMTSGGQATFAEEVEERSPGLLAAQFYTDFANPQKAVYTWNADEPNSFEAFVTGKTAFFLGYAYHEPFIRARAARLRFATFPLPQIDGAPVVNYANFWLQTVSKSSKNQNWAWDFIQFATSAPQVTKYLAAAKKPTARRALISTQVEDEFLGAFASQVLTAKSWYRGRNAQTAENALLKLIDDLLAGREPQVSITDAQNKVNQTL